VGDIFPAIATPAGTDVLTLCRGFGTQCSRQTGLLRLTWDNGDGTVLVNSNLRGVTLGWNLQSTPQDELFAAIEGTAFHTRVILDRMAEPGVEIKRVINAGGIPQKNGHSTRSMRMCWDVSVQVPLTCVVSLGSAIFAFWPRARSKPSRKRKTGFAPDIACMTRSRAHELLTKSFIPCTEICTLLWGTRSTGQGTALFDPGRGDRAKGYWCQPSGAIVRSLPSHAIVICALIR
jgi:hypothetical protein